MSAEGFFPDAHEVYLVDGEELRWLGTFVNRSMAEGFVAVWPLAYPSWAGVEFKVVPV